ncbi:GMC family oxidoreductase [Marinobacter halodurans]|uniref:GMC family oxidoreductase n=1 Tax=Marinobacter halodurans TaxID=2528979 RepID=A0ABY1ZEL2_9GAMM|nr:GMC family oxidoreductase [Marinobacter halodurans]TBW48728.1 GMC family oxidoreductase [Marinobacter halodurans]
MGHTTMLVLDPENRHYDVAIIGSGPAGITLALRLARLTPFRIGLLESGLLEAAPTVQALALAQLDGDLGEAYFPMHTQRRFGGSSTIWGGFCAVLEERAFLAGDWPIPYTELERWYPAAAAMLELPDNAYRRPHAAIEGTRDIVYKPFYLSPPVRFNEKYGEEIISHPRIDLILGHTCTRLEHSGSRVRSLLLRDSLDMARSPVRLTAGTTVLACGGVGNPRLLQLSGIGRSLPVGVGLMEHPHLYAVADMYLDWGRMQDVVDRQANAVHALQLADRYCVANDVLSFSADFNLQQLVSEPLLGGRREALFTPVSLRAEIAPHPANRVGDSDQLNALGQPLSRIEFHFRFREQAHRTWRLFAEALLRSGLGRPSTLKPSFRLNSGGHLMGTTRMGSDPRQSVVDGNGRVHTTDNLYVAGSSVFPAGGASNPTYTIVALTLRLGDHLATRLGGNAYAAS